MPNIHLTLAGPPEAAYPNGGDEALSLIHI